MIKRIISVDKNTWNHVILNRIIIGLISLFNDISTFVGYLMPKLFPSKNSSGTI